MTGIKSSGGSKIFNVYNHRLITDPNIVRGSDEGHVGWQWGWGVLGGWQWRWGERGRVRPSRSPSTCSPPLPSQITRHMLDCIYAHLYFTRGALAAPGGGGYAPVGATAAAIAAQGIASNDNRIMNMDHETVNVRGGGGGAADGEPHSRPPPRSLQVLAIYKDHAQPDDDEGLSLADAIQHAK